MALAKKQESFSYKIFEEKFFSDYPAFFLYLFLFSMIYALYKAFLFLLGLDTFFLGFTSSTTMFIVMLLFEIPFVYLFFVLNIYLLKRLFYPELKVKNYFLLGLKLFIIDLIFLILISVFGYLFMLYDTILTGILLIIILILSLFFVFVSYKTVMKKSLLTSFADTFKQIANPKSIAFFVLTLVIGVILFFIALGIVYAQILPDTLYTLVYPLILFVAFVMSYYSVN